MPIRPTTFAGVKPLSVSHSNRAFADVYVSDPAGLPISPTFQCLVDTGADYTILPMSVATQARIRPAGHSIRVRPAWGPTFSLPTHPSLNLVVEGYLIQVLVAFSTSAGFTPILGRPDAVAAFDIGFDRNNWYWG